MEYILDLIKVAGYFGYVVLFVVIFLESFPPTFFLPGDSLLFTTGFLASQGHFELGILIPVLYVASIFGYMFSYAMGQKIRDFIIRSNDKYWFKKKHLDQTNVFFEKYGDKTIIIGRFIPVVRSFGPTLAGSVNMSYRKFIRGVLIGGLLWTGGVTCLGYYLGKSIPGAHLYLTPIVLGIIFVSLVPVLIEYFHSWKKKRIKN